MTERLAFVPRPEPDEALGSWLARLAREYDMTASDLLVFQGLSAGEAMPDLDGGPQDDSLLRDLARLTGLSLDRLEAMAWQSGMILAPQCRTAYCAACWLEDLTSSRPLYRRRNWLHPAYLVCGHHRRPLLDSANALPDHDEQAISADLDRFAPDCEYAPIYVLVDRIQVIQQAVLSDALKPTLERSLAAGALRDCMIGLSSNLLPTRAPAPADQFLKVMRAQRWDVDFQALYGRNAKHLSANWRGQLAADFDFTRVDTTGYRRLLLTSAFMVFPAALHHKPLGPFQECLSPQSLAWLQSRAQDWPETEIVAIENIIGKFAQ